MAGEIVTVGGDVTVGPSAVLIRADDTGKTWTVLDVAGTGWLGLAPPAGPITRGVVRGTQGDPFVIVRVDAAGKFSAGETGTTKIEGAPAPVPVSLYTLPNGSTRALRQFDRYYPGYPGFAGDGVSPPVPKGGDPDSVKYLNRSLIPQFIEDLKRRVMDGEISVAFATAFAQRMAELGWVPPPGTEDGFWLPPGGGSVPLILQGGALTVTGAVNPRVLEEIESGEVQRVLQYTAEMTGRDYDEIIGTLSEDLRKIVQDGVGQEDFPSLEGALARLGDKTAIARGGLDVSREEILQGEGFGAVDLRTTEEKAAANLIGGFDKRIVFGVGLALVVGAIFLYDNNAGGN